ncbi:MAG: hypothetical protein H6573_10530 [Lewinellaceae bacterium]|nr:hypothetical protein [Phaeodactylibacter sp.]MCB0612698.1 hypothetical protein [Phaeodactylibacter sp.]MCB9347929.1 hypothetical protein [Lewinellaceae bacterium]
MRCFGATRLQDFSNPCLVTACNITARRAFFFARLDAKRDPGQDYIEANRETMEAVVNQLISND